MLNWDCSHYNFHTVIIIICVICVSTMDMNLKNCEDICRDFRKESKDFRIKRNAEFNYLDGAFIKKITPNNNDL